MSTPRYVRDEAGKKAYVRRSVDRTDPNIEPAPSAPGYDLFVDTRTGRYFAVPAPTVDEVAFDLDEERFGRQDAEARP